MKSRADDERFTFGLALSHFLIFFLTFSVSKIQIKKMADLANEHRPLIKPKSPYFLYTLLSAALFRTAFPLGL